MRRTVLLTLAVLLLVPLAGLPAGRTLPEVPMLGKDRGGLSR